MEFSDRKKKNKLQIYQQTPESKVTFLLIGLKVYFYPEIIELKRVCKDFLPPKLYHVTSCDFLKKTLLAYQYMWAPWRNSKNKYNIWRIFFPFFSLCFCICHYWKDKLKTQTKSRSGGLKTLKRTKTKEIITEI